MSIVQLVARRIDSNMHFNYCLRKDSIKPSVLYFIIVVFGGLSSPWSDRNSGATQQQVHWHYDSKHFNISESLANPDCDTFRANSPNDIYVIVSLKYPRIMLYFLPWKWIICVQFYYLNHCYSDLKSCDCCCSTNWQ